MLKLGVLTLTLVLLSSIAAFSAGAQVNDFEPSDEDAPKRIEEGILPTTELQIYEEIRNAEKKIDKFKNANRQQFLGETPKSLQEREKKALIELDALLSALRNCKDRNSFDQIQEKADKIVEILMIKPMPTLPTGESQQQDPVLVFQIRDLQNFYNLLSLKPDQLCKEFERAKISELKTKEQMRRYFAAWEQTSQNAFEKFEKSKIADARSSDAYQKRLRRLNDALREAAKNVQKTSGIVEKLWIIVLLIGIFSLIAMGLVRIYKPNEQLEWIGSGQVTQFMTVFILLIIILLLGLSGKLGENLLGTLLAGIGGHVLSRGVGKKESALKPIEEKEPSGSLPTMPNENKNIK